MAVATIPRRLMNGLCMQEKFIKLIDNRVVNIEQLARQCHLVFISLMSFGHHDTVVHSVDMELLHYIHICRNGSISKSSSMSSMYSRLEEQGLSVNSVSKLISTDTICFVIGIQPIHILNTLKSNIIVDKYDHICNIIDLCTVNKGNNNDYINYNNDTNIHTHTQSNTHTHTHTHTDNSMLLPVPIKYPRHKARSAASPPSKTERERVAAVEWARWCRVYRGGIGMHKTHT
eukprot:GHVR01164510.1.p1 GENE.GHVR01164510.1~~GHVR01164510.1.p1  ORF type:complete len:231 (-),score=71.45 GHVR01164510.1:82-774(-)